MACHRELLNLLKSENAAGELSRLYGEEGGTVRRQVARYAELVREHVRRFGGKGRGLRLFTAPGRIEVGGNHTDHNRGRVLAAAISLDAVAAACRNTGDAVTVCSEGHGTPFVVDLADLRKKDNEKGMSSALIRGVCRAFRDRGYKIGGFDGCVASDVAVGSGLSSSAVFEVVVATVLNHLYNDGVIPPRDIAIIGQYAENEYFGKPCGLMDQMTSAVGGLVTIDFCEPSDPTVKKVDFDFDTSGFDIVVVNTGGSHADLTPHYSSVAQEMGKVARALGGEALREFSAERLVDSLKELRLKVGDRAVLRALHFFAENQRVAEQVEALERKDFQRFLSLVRESGESSWMLCQNVYVPERPEEQGLSLALALSDEILKGRGAWRVHGGGFAGTILAFVPGELTAAYIEKMDEVFGKGAARTLHIRGSGACEVLTGG